MGRATKLIAAITALLVAVGTLVGTISMTVGKGPKETGGVVIYLNSPEAYDNFLSNNPAGG